MANYSLSTFIKPVTPTDSRIQIRDVQGVIKFTLSPCNVENIQAFGRNIRITSLGSTTIILDFSTDTESNSAIISLQNTIDDVKTRFPCDGRVVSSGTSGTSGGSVNSSSDGYLGIWRYNQNIIDSNLDPGQGYFTIDVPVWTLPVSFISFDDITFFPVGVNFQSYLDGINVGTLIRLQKFTDANVYKYLRIISVIPLKEGFEKYRVQEIATSGESITNNDQFSVTFFPQTPTYEEEFSNAQNEWIVNHNLNKKPEVIVYQTLPGNRFQQILALVEYVTPNQVSVKFNQPVTGFVRCA